LPIKSYLGSGVALKEAIKKYGKESFYKDIIEFLDIDENTMLKESYYIEKFNTLIPNGYNINPNGGNFSN